MTDRAAIKQGLRDGCSLKEIGRRIGRCPSVVSREVRRNRGKQGYQTVAADVKAERRRARPQARKVDADPVLKARVVRDLAWGRTPRQIAGRLAVEADGMVKCLRNSPTAGGARVSHEAIYTWIYALPKGELARYGIVLPSKRTRRRPRRSLGQRGAPIIGMTSIDDRPAEAEGRKVPGHWEGDLIIGRNGATAAATLVERTSRFLTILALPQGKQAAALCDALIEKIDTLPRSMRASLTWDQGTEMAHHAALTLATQLPVYFAHPRSPWERGTNENTNQLIRRYLPKGTPITDHQPYLDAIAEELNDCPRACLGYRTPREVFEQLLVASTA